MHIGLIGGIGPAATELYYRGLLRCSGQAGVPLDLTIVHADAATLVRNFENRDPDAQVEIFLRLTERLKRAGADAVAISSIGGHFCINPFEALSPLPVLNLIDAIRVEITTSGARQIGILGTDTVMETRFYGALEDVNVVVPDDGDLEQVHRGYVDMAVAGDVTEAQRRIFFEAGRDMKTRGAEVVLLGGTDLFLAFDGQSPGFETLDCAQLHINAISNWAAARP